MRSEKFNCKNIPIMFTNDRHFNGKYAFVTNEIEKRTIIIISNFIKVPKVTTNPRVVLPLCITIAMYACLPYEHPSIMEGILKCLPILTLMICIVLNSVHLKDENKEFSKKIFFGLLCGCIGDFLLIWPYCFESGIVAFAFGHINYIRAFGFSPLRLPLGVGIYGCLVIIIIWLQLELSGALAIIVPTYGIIIGTMVWRAISRNNKQQTFPTLCTATGAVCFMISDLLIAINKFKYELPYEGFLTMATYYGAQIGIATSVLDLK